MTRIHLSRSRDIHVRDEEYRRPVPKNLALMGSALLALSIGLTGCGSQKAQSQPSPVTTQSQGTPTPSPRTRAERVPPPEDDDVVQADRSFWQDYANNDAEGACSHTLGFANGQVVAMEGAFLTECVTALGAYPSDGTSLTIGDPVVYDGVIALVAPSGQVCGAESLTVDCSAVPDLGEEMPGSASAAEFDAALSAILTDWTNYEGGWAPDVLVKVGGTWQMLLPIADPLAAPPDLADDPHETQPRQHWTDDDFDDVCPSGGCGAVPGLPPFLPGGGLSLNGS